MLALRGSAFLHLSGEDARAVTKGSLGALRGYFDMSTQMHAVAPDRERQAQDDCALDTLYQLRRRELLRPARLFPGRERSLFRTVSDLRSAPSTVGSDRCVRAPTLRNHSDRTSGIALDDNGIAIEGLVRDACAKVTPSMSGGTLTMSEPQAGQQDKARLIAERKYRSSPNPSIA